MAGAYLAEYSVNFLCSALALQKKKKKKKEKKEKKEKEKKEKKKRKREEKKKKREGQREKLDTFSREGVRSLPVCIIYHVCTHTVLILRCIL